MPSHCLSLDKGFMSALPAFTLVVFLSSYKQRDLGMRGGTNCPDTGLEQHQGRWKGTCEGSEEGGCGRQEGEIQKLTLLRQQKR